MTDLGSRRCPADAEAVSCGFRPVLDCLPQPVVPGRQSKCTDTPGPQHRYEAGCRLPVALFPVLGRMGCLLLINCVQVLFVLMACCPEGGDLAPCSSLCIVADAAAPGKGGSWPLPHGFAAGCGLAFPGRVSADTLHFLLPENSFFRTDGGHGRNGQNESDSSLCAVVC